MTLQASCFAACKSAHLFFGLPSRLLRADELDHHCEPHPGANATEDTATTRVSGRWRHMPSRGMRVSAADRNLTETRRTDLLNPLLPALAKGCPLMGALVTTAPAAA